VIGQKKMQVLFEWPQTYFFITLSWQGHFKSHI
jgi:hypothetical protein